MIQTTDFAPEGAEIGLDIEPEAIHIMKKSEYSGLYGDYSLDIDPEALDFDDEDEDGAESEKSE
jgi:spermidine/putrescine transport system ATP-binding protein